MNYEYSCKYRCFRKDIIRKTASVIHKLDRSQSRSTRARGVNNNVCIMETWCVHVMIAISMTDESLPNPDNLMHTTCHTYVDRVRRTVPGIVYVAWYFKVPTGSGLPTRTQ